MYSFSAKIEIIGVNPYVLLPDYVLQLLFEDSKKNKGAIPVIGTINGKEFIQTLVKYAGKWRLYVNGVMIKATGLVVGDIADIQITFDAVPRIEPIHQAFEKALARNKKAKEVFENYAPSRQKEINRYLNNIKSKETLQKNIERIVKYLSGEKVGYFVLLRNKA